MIGFLLLLLAGWFSVGSTHYLHERMQDQDSENTNVRQQYGRQYSKFGFIPSYSDEDKYESAKTDAQQLEKSNDDLSRSEEKSADLTPDDFISSSEKDGLAQNSIRGQYGRQLSKFEIIPSYSAQDDLVQDETNSATAENEKNSLGWVGREYAKFEILPYFFEGNSAESKSSRDERRKTKDETKPSIAETKPSRDETKSSVGETKPSRDETKPSRDKTKSSVGETKSSKDKTKPSVGEIKPSKDETKSSRDETKSSKDEAKFSIDETKSSRDETKSSIDETKSSIDETKSSKDEAKSSIDETKSSKDEAKSSKDEAKSSIDETKSSRDETKSSIDETKPSRDKTNSSIDVIKSTRVESKSSRDVTEDVTKLAEDKTIKHTKDSTYSTKDVTHSAKTKSAEEFANSAKDTTQSAKDANNSVKFLTKSAEDVSNLAKDELHNYATKSAKELTEMEGVENGQGSGERQGRQEAIIDIFRLGDLSKTLNLYSEDGVHTGSLEYAHGDQKISELSKTLSLTTEDDITTGSAEINYADSVINHKLSSVSIETDGESYTKVTREETLLPAYKQNDKTNNLVVESEVGENYNILSNTLTLNDNSVSLSAETGIDDDGLGYVSYDLGVASEGERGNMDHTTTIEYSGATGFDISKETNINLDFTPVKPVRPKLACGLPFCLWMKYGRKWKNWKLGGDFNAFDDEEGGGADDELVPDGPPGGEEIQARRRRRSLQETPKEGEKSMERGSIALARGGSRVYGSSGKNGSLATTEERAQDYISLFPWNKKNKNIEKALLSRTERSMGLSPLDMVHSVISELMWVLQEALLQFKADMFRLFN